MIFDLVRDFSDVLAVLPAELPRYRTLKLLDEAVRRGVHFIDRPPHDAVSVPVEHVLVVRLPRGDAFHRSCRDGGGRAGEFPTCAFQRVA